MRCSTQAKPIQYCCCFYEGQLTVRFRGLLSVTFYSVSLTQFRKSTTVFSAPPQVQTGRSCPCRRYEDVKFVWPVRSLVMQTCSGRLQTPAACHLRTMPHGRRVFHVCCHTLILVLVGSSFASSGRMAVSYTHLDVYKRQVSGSCRHCRY